MINWTPPIEGLKENWEEFEKFGPHFEQIKELIASSSPEYSAGIFLHFIGRAYENGYRAAKEHK